MRHLTYHAVEQFIRRWEPNKNYKQAKEELEILFRNATSTGKTTLGDTIMVSAYRPEVRFVVKDRDVCVTILPPGRAEDVMKIYEEEILELIEGNKSKIQSMSQEIIEYTKQKEAVDAERELLGKKKSDLCQKITSLENQIHNLKTFTFL